jgi:hypothetical protein
MFVTL